MRITTAVAVTVITAGSCCIVRPALADGACFAEAAAHYRVPERLLRAISYVESRGDPNAINRNTDGTYDIGHMQINSAWMPVLKRYRITEEQLKEPCLNTHIGAWVLADNFARMGFTWNAVGAYNAASPDKRVTYARKIAAALLAGH